MLQTDRYEKLRKELDAERLIERARKEAGLSDFGDESFIEPYKKLLDCTARESDFHPEGLEIFKFNVVRGLVNRLRTHDDIVRHPEILDEDVSNPIVIVGLPRSGTTKLQRMLSAPDDVQKTYLWRLLYPARFPNALPGRPDPRIAAAGGGNVTSDDNPDMQTVHVMTGGEPEEDWVLFESTFNDREWAITHGGGLSFFDWALSKPELDNYRYVRKLLQYLQWQDGGKRERPWILKSTGHMSHMAALLACFPKATLIHPHRDPRSSIPSMAKLQYLLWQMTLKDVDPKFAGKKVLEWWSRAMDTYLDARDRLKLDGRILDVKYEDIREDPMPIMHEAYRRAGRILTAEAEQKMLAWDKANEQHQFGQNQYSLEEYGLSNERIDKAFEKYISRFIDR